MYGKTIVRTFTLYTSVCSKQMICTYAETQSICRNGTDNSKKPVLFSE